MKKVSESIAHVMEYIKFSEMGGEVDDTDSYYSTYEALRDLLWKVKDEEEILDEDTQTLIPAYLPEPPRVINLDDYDVDMDAQMWDN
jgi:hypothetical protein